MLSYGVKIMNKEQIIKQLESLKINQEDFIDYNDKDCEFLKDVKALEETIEILKNKRDDEKQIKEYYQDLFNRLFEMILSLDYEKNTKKTIHDVMIELYYLFKKEI